MFYNFLSEKIVLFQLLKLYQFPAKATLVSQDHLFPHLFAISSIYSQCVIRYFLLVYTKTVDSVFRAL